MNVTFSCHSCEQTGTAEFAATDTHLVCPNCKLEMEIPEGALADGELHHCLVCPSTELFIRKDFPQRLGVTIVVIGFALSCIAWYNYHVYLTFGILFATAFIDVLLYVTVGDCLNCYRCSAQYRGLPSLDKHGAFDLSTHERYRQQAARLAQQTAGTTNSAGR
jgi:hypothetical protein